MLFRSNDTATTEIYTQRELFPYTTLFRSPVETVRKVLEGSPHVVDLMSAGKVQLMVNTTEGKQAVADSYSLRREALLRSVPYYTTVRAAQMLVAALAKMKREGGLGVLALQQHLAGVAPVARG